MNKNQVWCSYNSYEGYKSKRLHVVQQLLVEGRNTTDRWSWRTVAGKNVYRAAPAHK